MKKIFILMVILSVLVSALVIADADVSFTVPSPIVKDVPFDISVEMNSNNDNVARIQLYTTSQSQQINFLSASRGSWLPDSIVQKNGALDNGKKWWYNVGPTAPYFDSSVIFKNVVTLRAQTRVDDTLMLTAEDNLVALYPNGEATITSVQGQITTSSSICGDGVVGYVDANTNGVEDTGEIREACDDGNTDSILDGCSETCTYIDLGYSCTNTNFGDRNSVCSPMPPGEFFVEKMNALLVDARCYPTNTHPAVIYDWFCDRDQNGDFQTNNDALTNNRVISSVLRALSQLLASLFP